MKGIKHPERLMSLQAWWNAAGYVMLTIMDKDAPIAGSWRRTLHLCIGQSKTLQLPETEPQGACKSISKVRFLRPNHALALGPLEMLKGT